MPFLTFALDDKPVLPIPTHLAERAQQLVAQKEQPATFDASRQRVTDAMKRRQSIVERKVFKVRSYPEILHELTMPVGVLVWLLLADKFTSDA